MPCLLPNKEYDMETMRTKKGLSYREKVYDNGKAITKTFKRKSDAVAWKQNKAAEIRRKNALGIADIESIDFETFSQKWLEIKKNQGLAEGTIDRHRTEIRFHFAPVLGKSKMESIHLGMAQKIVQECQKKGLKAGTINRILVTLKAIFKDAVKLNHLIRNPLEGLEKIKEPPRSLSYWMPEDVQKFLAANKGDQHYLLYALALNTGMRRGELLGLCWDKVNLAEKRIEIARVRDGYGHRGTTKTRTIRHLPLSDAAFAILSKLAEAKRHQTFVFAKRDGTLPGASCLSNHHFKQAVRRAEVPKIRFHDLRATYASNFVMAKGDIFTLSKLLGHTKVEMTARKYAALHPDFMKGQVNTVQFQA